MDNIMSKYCDETGCVRRVIPPHLYCDKHVDNSSTITFTKADGLDVLGDVLVYIEGLSNKDIAKILTEYAIRKVKEKK